MATGVTPKLDKKVRHNYSYNFHYTGVAKSIHWNGLLEWKTFNMTSLVPRPSFLFSKLFLRAWYAKLPDVTSFLVSVGGSI